MVNFEWKKSLVHQAWFDSTTIDRRAEKDTT
jgi:hypothetical protein